MAACSIPSTLTIRTRNLEQQKELTVSRAFQRQVAALRDERGATAVEYALMIALIALVIFGAVAGLGLRVDTWFRNPELGGALS